MRFFGGLGFLSCVSSLLILCSVFMFLVFMFSVMCFGVLNRLLSIGMLKLVGFLNSNVGFLVCNVWLYILVILSMGEIGIWMCFNVLCCFSWVMKLWRFLNVIGLIIYCKILYFICFWFIW